MIILVIFKCCSSVICITSFV